ncbi:MAG: AMP-binding protein, partial [Sheuella sp.]|nr:AMP-binding protein [Sheuella sp.]
MNLGRLLTHTAKLYPAHTALIQGEDKWTWSQINARVNAMANALRKLGIRKGDRILLQSRNNIQTFESGWVAFKLGCVWVPTNFRLTPPEVAYLGASSGAVAMVVEDLFQGHTDAVKAESSTLKHVITIGQPRAGELDYETLIAQHLGEDFEEETVAYDDPLWFFYTSGTTGKPKAGILTHGQMAFVVTNHLADLIPGTTEKDCSIAVAPLSHGAGIHALLNVARGAATILLPSEKFDPAVFWEMVQRYRVTNLFTVPTIIKMLVEHPAVDEYDHSSLRYVIYAGAPMYRADQKRALQKLGKVLVQYFGLGEVTGNITVLPPDMHAEDDSDPNANIGSCGRPRVGMEVAILNDKLERVATGEIGEICCRGPAVFAGYHGNPDATAKALKGGWFHTGDLGKLDARGLLYITGRESDMYIS